MAISVSAAHAADYGLDASSGKDSVYFRSPAKLEFIEGKTSNIVGGFTFDPQQASAGVQGTFQVEHADDLPALVSGGQRFEPVPVVLDAIRSISAALAPDQSPCLELPAETWSEPRLLSECPQCHQPLRFNPFITDALQQDPAGLALERGDRGDEIGAATLRHIEWFARRDEAFAGARSNDRQQPGDEKEVCLPRQFPQPL